MMTDLVSLWLPIVASAVACFFASFVLWAASPWHKPDIKPVPDMDAADRALASLNLAPGFYYLPSTHDCKEMKSEAFQERYKRGPWASINVIPKQPNMGKNMGLTFTLFLVVSFLIAYLCANVLAPGTEYLRVFQIAGTAGILAYTFGGMPNAIWFGKPRGWILRDVVDSVIYGLITAGMFGWLWPHAAGLALPA